MAAPPKAVPWPEIAERIRKGDKARIIARELTEAGTPISHQAISKRARKEGWKMGEAECWLQRAQKTETARIVSNPQTTAEKKIAKFGHRTPENAAIILARLAEGRSEATAIAGVVTDGTWKRWKHDDKELNNLVDAARRESLGSAELEIVKAEQRGDSKAALMRLQSAPQTREEWGGAGARSGGAKINVILNIPRASAPGDDAKVIDGNE